MFEAAVRQYREWGAGAEGHAILVALARYLAAHSPTERARFQTATIARRLHRGGRVYEDEPDSDPRPAPRSAQVELARYRLLQRRSDGRRTSSAGLVAELAERQFAC